MKKYAEEKLKWKENARKRQKLEKMGNLEKGAAIILCSSIWKYYLNTGCMCKEICKWDKLNQNKSCSTTPVDKTCGKEALEKYAEKKQKLKNIWEKQKLENVRRKELLKNKTQKSDTESDTGLRSDMASGYDMGSSSGYEEEYGSG